VAVLIPCYNEEAAISGVIYAFHATLPEAAIYVYDNNSADGTVATATAAGAIVCQETLQGKGHVVRRMFADIEADIYVLVDGDGTYDASAAPDMISMLIDQQLDMVTALRIANSAGAYRRGHLFGNSVLSGAMQCIFGKRISDMLSGYRAFSRRFVKTFPALASGFETETEFSVHALELRMPVGELRTAYGKRGAGSASKLRTYTDGLKVLRMIIVLVKNERPLQLFSFAGALLLVTGCGLGVPVITEFLHTGLVPRLPTAVLATGFVVLSFLSFSCGLILDSVTRGRREMKRLAYLAVPGVGTHRTSGL
jgi:glycosyltransferase involved in cell wall biosynthesis